MRDRARPEPAPGTATGDAGDGVPAQGHCVSACDAAGAIRCLTRALVFQDVSVSVGKRKTQCSSSWSPGRFRRVEPPAADPTWLLRVTSRKHSPLRPIASTRLHNAMRLRRTQPPVGSRVETNRGSAVARLGLWPCWGLSPDSRQELPRTPSRVYGRKRQTRFTLVTHTPIPNLPDPTHTHTQTHTHRVQSRISLITHTHKHTHTHTESNPESP